MEFLKSIFGDPVPDAVTLILITFALVLALVLLIWLVRKIVGSPALKSARGRQPRLAVTDAATLDDKRRLVLVRRDNVEHLVMIGGASDVLIETGIVRNSPVTQKPATLQNEEPSPAETENKEILIAAAGTAGVAAVASAVVSDDGEAQAADHVVDDNQTAQAPQVADDPDDDFGDQLSELSRNLEDVIPDAGTDTADAGIEVAEKVEATLDEAKDEIAEIATDTAEELKDIVPDEVSEEEIDPDMDIELSGLEDALGEELSDIADETPKESGDPDTAEIETPDPAVEVKTETAAPDVDSPVDAKAEPSIEVVSDSPKQDPADMEDEMQKLLDELAGEKA